MGRLWKLFQSLYKKFWSTYRIKKDMQKKFLISSPTKSVLMI